MVWTHLRFESHGRSDLGAAFRASRPRFGRRCAQPEAFRRDAAAESKEEEENEDEELPEPSALGRCSPAAVPDKGNELTAIRQLLPQWH